jgi:G:T-mismatch repair DNA endonuclease (very short patch repair protein)
MTVKTRRPKKAVKAGFIRAARRKKRLSKRKRSDLEILVKSWLDEDGIEYKEQFPIGRKCHVDFLICPDVVLEVQGCYYHGHSCQKPLSKMQTRARYKDSRRFKFFLSQGYKILLLWGCAMKEHPQRERRKIKRASKGVDPQSDNF